MAKNNRVFYAVQQFSMTPNGEVVASGVSANTLEMHGIQSVGITTTFNLEQVFELGQLAIYENIEGIPDIEVTVEKVLDGYPPVFLVATRQYADQTLVGRSNAKCQAQLGIIQDTKNSVGIFPTTEVYMSGLFVSSVSYTIPVDGSATESVTLVGNNKRWRKRTNSSPHDLTLAVSGRFTGNDDVPAATTGVSRREDVSFIYLGDTGSDLSAASAACGAGIVNSVIGTILPPEIDGISTSGTNDFAGGVPNARVQSITTSVDLGREELFQLGKRGPYHRYVSFPVEVSTEITTLAISGDMIDAKEESDNLSNRRIRLQLKEGLHIDMGDKNKLASVGFSGGDAGGDNVELSFSYTTFNDFTVKHLDGYTTASHSDTAGTTKI